MKNPMKKVLALVLAIAMTLSLVACSGGSEDAAVATVNTEKATATATIKAEPVAEEAEETEATVEPQKSEEATEAPEETTEEAPTEAPTETPTEAPVEEPAEEPEEEAPVEEEPVEAEEEEPVEEEPVEEEPAETQAYDENGRIILSEESSVDANGVVIPGLKTNLITGEDTLCEDTTAYDRSVSVMINNAKASLPQLGLGSADLIWEIPVEGMVTRLMAVFGDMNQIPSLVSIRSCRYYYPLLAVGYDSVYIHWGLDMTVAKATLERLDIDHIDGDEEDEFASLFDRDQARLDADYDYEHTSRLDGTRIPEVLRENNVRTELKAGYVETLFNFSRDRVEADGRDCGSIRVNFTDSYWSTFDYDAEENIYYKGFSGNPHIDGTTGEQLTFSNLIFLERKVGFLPDDDYRRKIDVITKEGKYAKGYICMGGKFQQIQWQKPGEYEKLRVYDLEGNELTLNAGKTYIAIYTPNSLEVTG